MAAAPSASLFALEYRLDSKRLFDKPGTALMDYPGCRAHLRIVKFGDVSHRKIHESALFLQQPKKIQNFRIDKGSVRW